MNASSALQVAVLEMHFFGILTNVQVFNQVPSAQMAPKFIRQSTAVNGQSLVESGLSLVVLQASLLTIMSAKFVLAAVIALETLFQRHRADQISTLCLALCRPHSASLQFF